MDVSQFLKASESEDTLQNIRKEYLNSKRTLEELMTKQSPTKKMEQRKKVSLEGSDDELRRQLREALGRGGNVDGKINAKVEEDEGKIFEMERRLARQEIQIQSMRNEMYQMNSMNQSLQGRIGMMEEQLRYIMNQHVAGRVESGTTNQGHYLDRAQSAPSTSSTSEWLRGSMNDTEDTKVLLGWKQHGHTRNQGPIRNGGRRSFSNLDDSTTKLINLSG